MKLSKIIIILIIATTLLAACGGGEAEVSSTEQSSPSAVTSDSVALGEDYQDALTLKNQIILGTLRLEGTGDAVTADQAKTLLPFWQAYRSLTESGNAAVEETEAVQDQILDAMIPGQIAAIAVMKLTNDDLQTYYVEIGVKDPVDESATPNPDTTGVPMKDLSPEAKETAKAERGIVSSSSGRGVIMMDKIIELLESK
ncbi:MAG: hypothetical protein U9R25_06160 [Chloroflexota bacterium]|nr:hypothetical protein [Chloroflexota bacterium]